MTSQRCIVSCDGVFPRNHYFYFKPFETDFLGMVLDETGSWGGHWDMVYEVGEGKTCVMSGRETWRAVIRNPRFPMQIETTHPGYVTLL